MVRVRPKQGKSLCTNKGSRAFRGSSAFTRVNSPSLLLLSSIYMGKAASRPTVDRSPQVKLVLLGSPAVGKTSLALYQVHGVFQDTPSVSSPLMLYQFGDSAHALKAVIMDSLTDEDLELRVPCRLRSIQNADCAVVVFAYNDRRSWESVPAKLQVLLSNLYTVDSAVLVGNKADVEERVVTDEEIQGLLKAWPRPKLTFFRVSCRSGTGVRLAFNRALQLGSGSRRVMWEGRKGLVYLLDYRRRSEEELPSRSLVSLGGRLCEALPSLLLTRRGRHMPRLDSLPPNVLLMVAKALLW